MRLWKQNVLIIIILILLVLCAVSISRAGAGSFTIVSNATFANSKIHVTQIYDGAKQTNYSGAGLFNLGKYGPSSNLYYDIVTFTSLIDTLRIIGSAHQIDSARFMVTTHAAGTTTDSIFASVYEILRTYTVGTGLAADTCGVTWDSANMTGDGSCGGTPTAWGTAGCGNTTTDRKATRETVTGHADSILITSGIADNDDTTYFWISGATIADTNNFKGLLIMPVAYGADDGVQSMWGFHERAGVMPELTVWYSDKSAGTTTPALRRRALIQQ